MKHLTITEQTKQKLEIIVKQDSSYRTRDRAKAILLSNEGVSMKEIAKIFNKSRRTIHRWFKRFKNEQIENLKDLKGKGRKPILDIKKDSRKILAHMKNNSLKEACAIINTEFKNEFNNNNNTTKCKSISTETLKRFLKKTTFHTRE